MLATYVRLYQNPYSPAISDDELFELLTKVARTRANHVESNFEQEKYEDNNLGLALLVPGAPAWMPSSQTLLATVAIGPEGGALVINAIAKAVDHRDHGHLAGFSAFVDMSLVTGGSFTWGVSCKVDDAIGGASGQSQIDDACEAGHALVSFLFYVRSAVKDWTEAYTKEHGARPSWYSDTGQPGSQYVKMEQLPAIRQTGAAA